MTTKCIDIQCKRTSRAICKCCSRDLCLQHFWQHNDLLVSQINLLKKTVNDVDARFQFLDLSKSVSQFRQDLKQWRIDSYAKIDRYYGLKSQELDRLVQDQVNDQRTVINQLKKRVEEFIETEYSKQDEIDSIKTRLHDLNGRFDTIEKAPFSMKITPLTIDESSIQFRK